MGLCWLDERKLSSYTMLVRLTCFTKVPILGNLRRSLLWKLTTISDISGHVTSVEELHYINIKEQNPPPRGPQVLNVPIIYFPHLRGIHSGSDNQSRGELSTSVMLILYEINLTIPDRKECCSVSMVLFCLQTQQYQLRWSSQASDCYKPTNSASQGMEKIN